MSTRVTGSQSIIEESRVQTPLDGTKTQNSKKILFTIAIVVGVAALFFGISSSVGLLQNYGKIHLPASWFSEAVNWLGTTPHSWALWSIAVGGVLAGGVLTPLGAYKLHKPDEMDDAGVPQNNLITPVPQKGKESGTGSAAPINAIPQRAIPEGFTTEHYNILRTQNENYLKNLSFDRLLPNHYASLNFGNCYSTILLDNSMGLYATQMLKLSERLPASVEATLTASYKPGLILNKDEYNYMHQFSKIQFEQDFKDPAYVGKINMLLRPGSFLIAPTNGIHTCVLKDFDNELKSITSRQKASCEEIAQRMLAMGFTRTQLPPRKKH